MGTEIALELLRYIIAIDQLDLIKSSYEIKDGKVLPHSDENIDEALRLYGAIKFHKFGVYSRIENKDVDIISYERRLLSFEKLSDLIINYSKYKKIIQDVTKDKISNIIDKDFSGDLYEKTVCHNYVFPDYELYFEIKFDRVGNTLKILDIYIGLPNLRDTTYMSMFEKYIGVCL